MLQSAASAEPIVHWCLTTVPFIERHSLYLVVFLVR